MVAIVAIFLAMENQNEKLLTISEWAKTPLCLTYKVGKCALYRAMKKNLIFPVSRPLSGRGILFAEKEIRRYLSLGDS